MCVSEAPLPGHLVDVAFWKLPPVDHSTLVMVPPSVIPPAPNTQHENAHVNHFQCIVPWYETPPPPGPKTLPSAPEEAPPPRPPSPQPPAACVLLPVSVTLAPLGTSCTWDSHGFCPSLTGLCHGTTSSGLVHAATRVRTPFLFGVEERSTAGTDQVCYRFPISGHLLGLPAPVLGPHPAPSLAPLRWGGACFRNVPAVTHGLAIPARPGCPRAVLDSVTCQSTETFGAWALGHVPCPFPAPARLVDHAQEPPLHRLRQGLPAPGPQGAANLPPAGTGAGATWGPGDLLRGLPACRLLWSRGSAPGTAGTVLSLCRARLPGTVSRPSWAGSVC